uniref:Si:ch211-63o20.7 n=1 Tax=Sphaeramia orbicularis TaxID=375764 RepID=A0A673AYA7_9TELE
MEELYTLEKEVGRGSYGVVFEGHMSKTGQKVAIKRLPCTNPECMELYLQELWAMRATAQNHTNVIALHSCLQQTGPHSLKPLTPGKLPTPLVESVLKGTVVGAQKGWDHSQDQQDPQYCDGGDLNQYLLSRPPDEQHNHSVVQQLSSAVAFLHHLGIIHRDLKPDNVLVCVTHKGPVVKVADFGLSKMSGAVDDLSRQHFSSTCGSDFYMAPEVWGGVAYTAQADIFSLGVMFWAILERITFVEEGTTQEQLGAYVSRGRWLLPLGEALWENSELQLCIPMRSKRAPPLPPPGPALCRLLMDMLASDPDARPHADQLETRVHQALDLD